MIDHREAAIKLLMQQQEILYELSQRNLATFTQQAWHVLEPNTELKWSWHLDYICEHLEAVSLGQLRRLIVNIPPRNLKSTLVSVCWPAWTWAQKNRPGNPLTGPSARFITTSYSQKLSTKHSVNCRTLIQSPWYQEGWGHQVQLSDDTNRQDQFATTARGHRIATSMGGSATGEGGNCLIVDDPHDTTSAGSDVQRATDLEDFDLKFTSRLDDKKLGAIVIVMQRLHVLDLTGHVIAKDPGGWTHVRLPAEAEGVEVADPKAPGKTIRIPEKLTFPITKRWVERPPGEILHPDKEGPTELAQAKKDQGSMGYAGQYQQRPVQLEGGVFKRAWWKATNMAVIHALAGRMDMQIQSWDFAVKDKVGNDFVVGLVLGRKGADRYVFDMVRDRMDFPASCNALVMLTRKHTRTYKKVIEAKANGPAVIATLKKTITGLVEMEPMGDKMQRANAIAPEVEAGNWHIPIDAPWASDFFSEMGAFPKGANDDIVDAFTQGAIVLRSTAPAAMPILGHGSGYVHG